MSTKRNHIISIIVAVILSFIMNKSHAAWLTWVNASPSQKSLAAQLNISVYWTLDNGFFAQLDDAQIKDLRTRGFRTEMLDAQISPGEYFLVFKVGLGKDSYPSIYLWENEHMRLVRMDESKALAAKASGYEMARLPEAPHPLKITEPTGDIAVPAIDTTIQRLVGMVSQPNLGQTILDLQNFNTRYTYSPRCDSAARYLYQRFVNMGLSTTYDVYRLGNDTCYNVVATYPGQVIPESIVIACGHFDSYSNQPYVRAPGADDDASGVAATLEIARVLSTARFRWTIKYLAFSGEEQWMKGSTHWVDSVAVPQNLKIYGVYNLDMIGYTGTPDTSLLYVTPNTPSRPLANLAESVNVQYNIGLHVSNYLDEDAAGDHTPFWQRGFKAVFVIEDSEYGIWNGSNPHYHTTHDTLGTLRMSLVRRATQLVVACLATLAKPIIGQELSENSTNLQTTQSLTIKSNPMRQRCLITYPQQTDNKYELKIFDAAGRLIKQWDYQTMRLSDQIIWSGDDDSGRKLPAGVYFVRFISRRYKAQAKLIVLE